MTSYQTLTTGYRALTTAELDAVASGDPDAAVIEALLSGQYSKRVVKIHAILAVAADRCPGAHARLEEAYALLAAAYQADPAAVHAILTHPSTGFWAAHCLRGLQSLPADPMTLAADLWQLAAFGATAAIQAGRSFTIEVPVRERTVFLPTLGLATLEPESTAPVASSPVLATVRHDGHRITITSGHSLVSLPPDPERDGPGWQGLRRLRADHDGTPIAVELDDLGPDRGIADLPAADRLDDEAVAAWQIALDGAWATLTRHHPRRAKALASGLRCIAPVKSVGEVGQSLTDAIGFGCIALTQPQDPMSFVETLIREFHHSVLAAVADLSPLHTVGRDAAPRRIDERLIEGLLQGAYGYLGVTSYWEAQRKVVSGRHRALADYEFARWRHQILLAADVVRDSGILTPTGSTIARGMIATAERWRDLPVAEEARWLAERAIADHWVSWQLRNCRPAQPNADATSSAEQNEEPRPNRPDEVPTTVLPQQILFGHGERSRLFRLRLTDPERLGELREDHGKTAATTSSADLAYATDDFERAANGYRTAIRANPGDIQAWSGLILATAELLGQEEGLAAGPEVVRSVYLAVIEVYLAVIEDYLEVTESGRDWS